MTIFTIFLLQIPSFPIFMNIGELNVDVKVNHATMILSEEEVRFIKVFHTLIFSEIIPVIKSFMVFDNFNFDNCFLITPGKYYFYYLYKKNFI